MQRGSDIDGETAGDESGTSVSLSANGKTLAVGAVKNAGGGSNRGHTRSHYWNGSYWVQVGTDRDGEADGDESGKSVSLSDDGDKVAIGANLNDPSSRDKAGQVIAFGLPEPTVTLSVSSTNISEASGSSIITANSNGILA